MPRTVRTSLWLLIASLAAAPIVSLVDPTPIPPLPEGSGKVLLLSVLIIGVPIFGLFVFLAVMTYRRRNWARWIHASLYAFGIVLFLPTQFAQFSTLPGIASLNAILSIAETLSLVLLFTPMSNAWYRADKSGVD